MADRRRLRRIVQSYRLDCGGRSDSEQLVESYIEGDEYSVELLVRDGVPHVDVPTCVTTDVRQATRFHRQELRCPAS